MASELSQFIEKELKSQDAHDDEHQQLLDDLRSKPLPVGSLPFYKRGAFKKVMVAVGVVALLVEQSQAESEVKDNLRKKRGQRDQSGLRLTEAFSEGRSE